MTTRPNPLRVVLTGSESVGKTTLAAQLAAHYGVLCVPEFVRGYAARKQAPLDAHDVALIARGQVALEDEHLAQSREAGHTLIVHDTDIVSTLVYSQHYYNQHPPFVEALAATRRADLYLLLDIDVPWVADGVRDRKDQRQEVHSLFHSTLTRLDVSFTIVHGSWSERLQAAIARIDLCVQHFQV